MTRKKTYLTLFLLTSIFELFWMRGSLLDFGGSAFSNHTTLCEYVTFMYGCYYMYTEKIKIEYHLFIWGVIVLFLPVISIIYEMAYPFPGLVAADIGYYDSFVAGNGYSLVSPQVVLIVFIKAYFKLVIFIQSILILRTIANDEDIRWLIKSLVKAAKCFILVGFCEYILSNVFGLSDFKDTATTFLLGLNEDTFDAQLRNGVYALTGFSREASHYVCALYMSTVALLFDLKLKQYEHRLKRWDMLWIPLAIGLLLLTGGFTAIFAIACIVIFSSILFTEHRNLSSWTVLRIMVLFSILIFVGWQLVLWLSQDSSSYFGARMQLTLMVLDNLWAGNYALVYFDSSLPRVMSIIDSLKNLLDRPVLGLGLSVQPAHSGLATFLTGVGFLGFIAWIRFLTCKSNGKRYDVVVLLFLYSVSMIFMGYIEYYTQCLPALLAEVTFLYMRENPEEKL